MYLYIYGNNPHDLALAHKCRKHDGRNDIRLTNINLKGRPAKNTPGFETTSRKLLFKLSPSVRLPLAFSMIPLSIMVMMGATRTPAEPAASRSTPTREPSRSVLYFRGIASDERVDGEEARRTGDEIGEAGVEGEGAAMFVSVGERIERRDGRMG